jgi:aspartyl protease family protein
MLGWLIAALIGLVALFLILNGSAQTADDTARWLYIAAVSAFSLLIALSLTEDYRGRFGAAFRHAAIWVGLGLVFIGGYAYRDEAKTIADRMAGELMPGRAMTVGQSTGEASVRLRKRDDGHFVARVAVEGRDIAFMVDTGASMVVLTPSAAEEAGIDVKSLKFAIPVQTANGSTYTAPVMIKSMEIGPIRLENVEAMVARPGDLNENLLGMSFLKRLRSYEASGDFLTLRG